jgi:ZIP family zinc transporter
VNDFLLVLVISFVAALLTYLGAPMAERFDVPYRVVSAGLQFAAGIIAALVAVSLMPPAIYSGPLVPVVLAFFAGGAGFVLVEYYSAKRKAGDDPVSAQSPGSSGFYVGILLDLLVDGMVIGVGSTLDLQTGLLLAVGMACSTMPLTFVTITTAKRQGMPPQRRRRLSYLFFICIIGGSVIGYSLLGRLSDAARLTLIALASGFLITLVTQSMIPEANREGEPSFAGILFVGGLSAYALLTMAL